MGINEGVNRQIVAANSNYLHKPEIYVMMSIGDWHNELWKESNNDCDEREVLNPRSSSGGATGIERYNHAPNQKQKIEGLPNWRSMENWGNGDRGIHPQAKQHSTRRRQKIKPSQWMAIMKGFVAANSPQKWIGPPIRSEHYNPLPMYMIHSQIAKCKTVIPTWACGR